MRRADTENRMQAVKYLMFVPLFLGAPALAQEAAPPTATEAAPVSDEELGRFVRAALAVEQIAADEALDQPQKQAAMKSAVEQTGLASKRFNEIALASQTDAALQERIQSTAAAMVDPAQPTR
jgi:hypothetical protein